MPDQEMPDSAYDLDVRAYGVLWGITKKFHAELKGKAEYLARNEPALTVAHVDQALAEINEAISRNLNPHPTRTRTQEIIYTVGTGAIGFAIAGVLPKLSIPSSDAIYVLGFIIGILLIAFVHRPK